MDDLLVKQYIKRTLNGLFTVVFEFSDGCKACWNEESYQRIVAIFRMNTTMSVESPLRTFSYWKETYPSNIEGGTNWVRNFGE